MKDYVIIFFCMLSGCVSQESPNTLGATKSGSTDYASNSLTFTEREVEPPKGFSGFCERNRIYCERFRESSAQELKFNADLLKILEEANQKVNGSIIPLHEWGGADYWKFPVVTGDCEDYCLLKQRMLADAGLDLGAMPLAAVQTPQGSWHAVLLVRTDRGILVLDNSVSTVEFHSNTGYEYKFVQNPNDMMTWVEFAETR